LRAAAFRQPCDRHDEGDTIQDRPLAAIGADGVFVKELERALREGRADYAVHSCKDLPSTLPTTW